jgi:SET domain-containing protein
MPKVLDKSFYKVKRGSAGLGLFAVKPIKRSAAIIEYKGVKKTNKEVEFNLTQYLFNLDNGYTLDGSPRWNTARYINHSCVPNAEAWLYGAKPIIKALRKIEPGEEITYDYGKEFFDSYIKPKGCTCPKHKTSKKRP